MPSYRLILLAAAAIVLPLAVAAAGTTGSVSVSRIWARATPAGAKVGAAYLELKGGESSGDTLVSVVSPSAGRVELHSTTEVDGVMRMRRLDAVAVGPGETRVFKPGGDHIMLLDLKAPLVAGGRLSLTLTFAKRGDVPVEATIEPLGAPGPGG